MPMVMALARVTVSLVFFTYASWSDYKRREVSNLVWASYAPIGLALTILDFFMRSDFSALPLYGLCFAVTSLLAIALFYVGAFGGADAKALMCLALAVPFYPQELSAIFHADVSPTMQVLFPMAVFSNSVLFAALTAIYMLLRNLAWRLKTRKPLFEGDQRNASIISRALILLTSYKLPLERLMEKWHIYPMEDVEKAGQVITRKLIIFPKDSERDAIVERLSEAAEEGIIPHQIWATPGLPMLIFITFGFTAALVFGDVIWNLVRLLLR